MTEDFEIKVEKEGKENGEEGEVEKKEEKEEKEKVEKNFLEDLQLVQAEFENYVKRVEKEKYQIKEYVKAELLLKLVQIKDDFDRILERNNDEGLKMLSNNFNKLLHDEGISEIKSIGERFNHELHEVVKKIGDEDDVIEEVQKGYMLGDKILRAAKVVVGGKNDGKRKR